MSVQSELERIRAKRSFENWDGSVTPERVKVSEETIRQLIDELIASGSKLSEKSARQAVDACIQRFNDLDDGWINTIEREDILDQIDRVIFACGLQCEDDWFDERDW